MNRLPLLLLALIAGGALAENPYRHVGVTEAQLSPDYWVERVQSPESALLDDAAIAAQNARLFATDGSVRTLDALPTTLSRATVRGWIESLSSPPSRTVYGIDGREIPGRELEALAAGLALGRIPAEQATRYGLVTRRASLRTYPTDLRIYRSPDDRDIDRFQESALFPGTPVVIAHASADGRWRFVASPLYAAWIEADAVAEGARDVVLGYAEKAPYVVVIGARAETVYTPEAPQLSELALDMGVRVPLVADWPGEQPVNGQHAYTAHVVELPTRDADGKLVLAPALLPKSRDVATGYLDFNRANLVRQGFKFLGERYGWGHSYDARDCSGFVSEVYRSVGLTLPRNTSDQAVSPALQRVGFDPGDDRATRLAKLATLDTGDLVYIPGHVMMVLGQDGGEPYVIHDTTGINRKDDAGTVRRVKLNGVSVTPLATLAAGDGTPLVDHITGIMRIRRKDEERTAQ